jgi:hypothetical protein
MNKLIKEYIDNNVKFLSGEIDQTSYHIGGPDEETTELIPDLIELHVKHNIITTNSQPDGVMLNFPHEGKYVQELKRSFVMCAIPRALMANLLAKLKNRPDIKYQCFGYLSPNDFVVRNFNKEECVTYDAITSKKIKAVTIFNTDPYTCLPPVKEGDDREFHFLETIENENLKHALMEHYVALDIMNSTFKDTRNVVKKLLDLLK